MYCIKCGRENKNEQLFCPACLDSMKNYPVKPGITVNIPIRPAAPSVKKRPRRKKHIKPEEQIRILRLRLRLIAVAWFVTLVAFAATAVMMLQLLNQRQESNIGQNYSTVTDTEG